MRRKFKARNKTEFARLEQENEQLRAFAEQMARERDAYMAAVIAAGGLIKVDKICMRTGEVSQVSMLDYVIDELKEETK